MLQNKKGLLLAGLAAFAYYKYSKMTPEQKSNLLGTLKEKGKKIFDQYVPQQAKDMFASQDPAASSATPEYGKGTF